MDNFEDPISLYSYHLPTVVNNEEKNNEKNLGCAQLKKESTKSNCATIRPRSSLAQRTNSAHIEVANLVPHNSTVKKQPLKTVAFGLTTNVDETVENNWRKKSACISTLQNTKFATPLAKVKDETKSLFIKEKNEMDAIKKENATMKELLDDLKLKESNLRQTVVSISSRVMELENCRTDWVKEINELRSKIELLEQISEEQIQNSKKDASNYNKIEKKKSDLAEFQQSLHKINLNANNKIQNYCENYNNCENLNKQNCLTQIKLKTLQPVSKRFLNEKMYKSNSPTIESENEDKKSDIEEILAVIEKQIREKPQMLERAKKLFCESDSMNEKQFQTQSKKNSCLVNSIQDNYNVPMPTINIQSLISEKIPNQQKQTTSQINLSPFNKKYTQRMMVERSEVITFGSPTSSTLRSVQPKVMSFKKKNALTNSHYPLKNRHFNYQENDENYEKKSYRTCTANDNDFFEPLNIGVDHDNDNDYDSDYFYNQLNNENLKKTKQCQFYSHQMDDNYFKNVGDEQEVNKRHEFNETKSQKERRERYRRR